MMIKGNVEMCKVLLEHFETLIPCRKAENIKKQKCFANALPDPYELVLTDFHEPLRGCSQLMSRYFSELLTPSPLKYGLF